MGLGQKISISNKLSGDADAGVLRAHLENHGSGVSCCKCARMKGMRKGELSLHSFHYGDNGQVSTFILVELHFLNTLRN